MGHRASNLIYGNLSNSEEDIFQKVIEVDLQSQQTISAKNLKHGTSFIKNKLNQVYPAKHLGLSTIQTIMYLPILKKSILKELI